ncbi:MAG: hypothetical protein IPK67_15160 [Planctomycetes bacterium]|nr:hypothetical protein [Planctomycetota bacterium]
MLAHFAVLILGRAADVSYVGQVDQIRSSAQAAKISRSNFIELAATKAAQVVQYSNHVESRTSIREMVELLSVLSLGEFSPLRRSELSNESSLERNDPLTVWARNRIHELSAGSPLEVATAILQFSFDGLMPPGNVNFDRDRLRWESRDRVSSFLSSESLQAYRAGKPAK